jgi:hypothetical protein
MGKTPDFRINKSIPDLIADTRRPNILPETGWYKVGMSSGYEIGSYFLNSWLNDSSPTSPDASWYLSEDGEVRLRGKITGGALGVVAFLLPEEVRPEFAETWICAVDGGGTANVSVYPDGSLIVETIN